MKPETEILLQQFESLNNKVTLYFPNSHPDNVNRIVERITKDVGGCTVTPNNQGYWNNGNEIVQDDITLITVFCDDETIPLLVHLANNVRVEYRQDCVALEVNGQLLFIE